MPILATPQTAVEPPPEPALVEPWSWTVVELGPHLTENQRQTLLARFRALGYDDATTWPTA